MSEKCGKFKDLNNLISVYNGKRGLHIVVLYLEEGKWRIPWNFRVWKSRYSQPSPNGITNGA